MVLMIALQQKKYNYFGKAIIKFCLSLHYNGDESYMHVNKTRICKSKTNDNLRWYNFCLGSVSEDFTKDEQSGNF